MEYTTLGTTDIKISRICLGTMTWGVQNTAEEAFEQMDYALYQGVQFWDTAEMYAIPPTPETYGTTEEIIGQWFAKTGRRNEVILATKFSPMPWARGEALTNASAKSLPIAVDNSLKRLQTDYIDLYQLHWVTNRTYPAGANIWNYSPSSEAGAKECLCDEYLEILETLDGLVKAGKIRHIGLSNDSAWGVMQYVSLAEKHSLARIQSLQNEYHLLRRSLETDIGETIALEQVSLLAWSPLAMGILSGKYLNRFCPSGSRFSAEIMQDQLHRFASRFDPQIDQAVARYLQVAKRHGLDVCQMAIKFTIREPHLSTTIIGATSMEQLKTNIAAVGVDLNEDVLADIAEVRRDLPIPF